MAQLLDKRFRANPGYELLTREACTAVDCIPLENPHEPLYGYLRPRPSWSNLSYRQISPDTALLFLALQREGVVPEYFCSLLGRRAERFLLRLVLDGILEVEHSGQFVAGCTAREYLLGDEAHASRGHIAELSIDALKYADALGELPVPELTRRLYDFGRRPVTAAQKRAFLHPDTDFFGSLLNSVGSVLSTNWIRSPSADASWIMWRPIRIRGENEGVRYKLYVSPGLSDVAAAFRASADILGQSPGVRGLKIGRGLAGLTRADKIVAYFSRLDDLQQAGLRIQRELEGCTVHGVPFTAELSGDGLLSWGADPPRTDPSQRASWRLWLAGKLAAHFEVGRRSHTSGATWPFVLDRIRLDGVNPDTWVPDVGLWSSPSIIP
ncbi:MAG: hypothetical protein ACXW6K_15155 [Candidatus Binatia bacterium]